jgi:hypothetical protein
MKLYNLTVSRSNISFYELLYFSNCFVNDILEFIFKNPKNTD